jgi:hypothetical protein
VPRELNLKNGLLVDNSLVQRRLQLLKAAEQNFRAAENIYRLCLTGMQKVCPHPPESVVWTKYTVGVVFDGMLPHAICKDCGIEEVAWSFRVLRDGTEVADRQEIYRLRPGVGMPVWVGKG